VKKVKVILKVYIVQDLMRVLGEEIVKEDVVGY
jgi:hypothetical protein